VDIKHKDTKTQSGTKDPTQPDVEVVAREVVDAAFKVHTSLGPGLLESVYEVCMAHELAKRSLRFERQKHLAIVYDGLRIENALRLDLLVEDCLVVELKAVEQLAPVHKIQMLTYLRLSGHRLGLLINFNVPLIKDGISRIVL